MTQFILPSVRQINYSASYIQHTRKLAPDNQVYATFICFIISLLQPESTLAA
jgi:hypothetical protein